MGYNMQFCLYLACRPMIYSALAVLYLAFFLFIGN